MKSLLITLALVASSLTASARSIDRTPVVATVSGYEHGIVQVALLADGRLQVVRGQLGVDQKEVETIVLSKPVQEDLFSLARNLAKVEIKEERKLIVCAMVEPLSLSSLQVGGYNYETNKFDSKLRLILTNDSCATSYTVIPVQDWAKQRASELRKALVILALNTVKSEEQE